VEYNGDSSNRSTIYYKNKWNSNLNSKKYL
jgi:hypothetical protein